MTSLPAVPEPGLADLEPVDPSQIGWPPTLPIEVAMNARPVAEICADHGLSQTEWVRISTNPAFVVDLSAAVEAFEKEGAGFRTRCRIQAIELLKESWRMIHAPTDEVPAGVKADLIKFTIRAAGYDGSQDKSGANAAANATFQIAIDLRRE